MIEVLKQALEAFEAIPEEIEGWIPDKCTDAVIAIKQAIAELESQEPSAWVGLTDEEIEEGIKQSWVTEQAFQSAAWWAEAKLKEKNT